MLVVHFITRSPEESKSPEAAVSEGQDLHLRQEGQEGLVAQVPVASGGPLLEGHVLLVGVLCVDQPADLHFRCDASRASASDPQEAQEEGQDEPLPLALPFPSES